MGKVWVKPIRIYSYQGEVHAVAYVDPQDAYLAKYRWHLHPKGHVSRDLPRTVRGKKAPKEALHRVILGLTPGDGLEGDHIDGNKLNNRRKNLRIVTHAQQNQNLSPRVGYTSRYRGVHWYARYQKWQVQVQVGGVKHHLGYFEDEDEAGRTAHDFRVKHMTHYNPKRSTHGTLSRATPT